MSRLLRAQCLSKCHSCVTPPRAKMAAGNESASKAKRPEDTSLRWGVSLGFAPFPRSNPPPSCCQLLSCGHSSIIGKAKVCLRPISWGTSMASAKETMAEIIARQPEDSSYDEILRELAFARMVQRGLEDSDAGRTLLDEQVKEKLDSWRK